MSKALTFLLLVAAGVGLGYGFLEFRREDAPPPEPPAQTATGRSTVFYVDATPEEAQQQLRKNLRLMTSRRAGELGDSKDDIVLLLRDASSVEVVVELFAERARQTLYEASAFVDLFSRAKNPAFVPLLASLFDHGDYQVLVKLPRAAEIQADPALTPLLLRLYERMERQMPGKGSHTRERIMIAAGACGGPDVAVLFRRALKDPYHTVRSLVAAQIGALGLEPLADDLPPLLNDEIREVRFHTAASLVRLGRPGGEALILESLDPRDKGWGILAAEAAVELDLKTAIPVLEKHLPELEPDHWGAFMRALIALGDRSHLKELEAIVRAGNDPKELGALGALAAADHRRFGPLLREALKRGSPHRIEAISEGLRDAKDPVDLELVKALVSAGPDHPKRVARAASRVGDALVPWLAERLAASEDPQEAVIAISLLGELGSDSARAALLAQRKRGRHRRLCEERLRLLDLSRMKKGLPL